MLVNDSDSSIKYTNVVTTTSGQWKSLKNRPNAYMQDAHATSGQGNYCEYTFTGSGIGFISEYYTDPVSYTHLVCFYRSYGES